MIKKVIYLFLVWRITLLIISFIAISIVPIFDQTRFLGGGYINYINLPLLFSLANFDGEHYISISIFGYKGLEQAFFPVYPLLIHFFSTPFYSDLYQTTLVSIISGLTISNIAFAVAMILLYKLIKLDYTAKISWQTLILICLFPTSFFFGSVYTESIFLLLVVGAFLSVRYSKWWLAGVLGAIASATRVFGVFLLPILLLEWWEGDRKIKDLFPIFIIPLGLIGYMAYQYNLVGDYLAFYHLQGTIGEQRQLGIILLPQVLWRYAKILYTVDFRTEIYQTVLLELTSCLLFLGLIFYGFIKKIRRSYILYCLIGLLLSPLQGSLSSVPRYVIILFPGFLSLSLYLENKPVLIKWVVVSLFSILLIIEYSLFVRGYWVG